MAVEIGCPAYERFVPNFTVKKNTIHMLWDAVLLFFSETADGLPSVAGRTKFAARTAPSRLRALYVTVTWPRTALGVLVCRFVRSSKPSLFAASRHCATQDRVVNMPRFAQSVAD